MKRLALFLLAFAPALALAQANPPVETFNFPTTQALSRAEPTLAADGFSLASAHAVRITVCAASGQTLSGAGDLLARYRQADRALWSRGTAKLTIPTDAAGGRCWTFEDMPILVRRGQALWITSGVTVSGGTTVTVDFDVQTR